MITYLLIGLGLALGMAVFYVFDTVEDDEMQTRQDVIDMLKEIGAGLLVIPFLWPVVVIAVPVVCADEIFAAWRAR